MNSETVSKAESSREDRIQNNSASASDTQARVLVMAAGTGGHVFPALSIVESLRERGVAAEWLGTPNGLENKLLANTGIKLHQINAKGLKGQGVLRLLLAPFMVLAATVQSLAIIRQVRPLCVLGMGGYVCGPGGLAARLSGKPLLLHEQNAVAGLANKILSVMANRVLEAFPNTFKASNKVKYTGNPVRKDLLENSISDVRPRTSDSLRILVVGGSLGALAINEMMPEMFQAISNQLPSTIALEFRHQAGSRNYQQSLRRYEEVGMSLDESHQVVEFIDDMTAAYQWADLVICRSGASTVSELAVMGVPAILIPYPHHKDQQQTHNGNWLVNAGAAKLVQQSDCSSESLAELVLSLQAKPDQLKTMSLAGQGIAIRDASEIIAKECLLAAGVTDHE